MSAASHRDRRRFNSVPLLVGLAGVFDLAFYTALAPLLPEFARRYSLSSTELGVLTGAYAAGVAVGSIPGGVLAGHVGPRRVVLGATLVLAFSCLAFGLAGSSWQLIAARLLQGVASGGAWTAGLAWVSSSADARSRGRDLGLVMSISFIGSLAGPMIGALASVTGVRLTFIQLAGIGVALTLAMRQAGEARDSRDESDHIRFSLLRDPAVALAFWLVALFALLGGISTVMGPIMLARAGIGAIPIGVTFLVSAAGGAALSVLAGRSADRHGAIRGVRLALALCGAAVLLGVFSREPIAVASLLIVLGSALGALITLALTLLARTFERRELNQATAFGLMNTVWAPGQLSGSLLAGTLAEHSITTPWVCALALILLSIAATIAPRGPR